MLKRLTILWLLLVLCLSVNATYRTSGHCSVYRPGEYRPAEYRHAETRLATYRPYQMRSTNVYHFYGTPSRSTGSHATARRLTFGYGGSGYGNSGDWGGLGDLGDPDSWNDPLSGGGTTLGDLDDPDSWNDPHYGGGGSVIGDLLDPDNWNDPLSGGEVTPLGDLDDPDDWTDPYNGTPIGDVPMVWFALLLVVYSIGRAARQTKKQRNE